MGLLPASGPLSGGVWYEGLFSDGYATVSAVIDEYYDCTGMSAVYYGVCVGSLAEESGAG